MRDDSLAGSTPTVVERRPAFEGANICAWIGFKHIMYMAEEAVLEHLRGHGLRPGQLYVDHGLCIEIVDSGLRLLKPITIDDVVRIEVTPRPAAGPEMVFSIRMSAAPNDSPKLAIGEIRVALCRAARDISPPVVPEPLAPHIVPELRRGSTSGDDPLELTLGRGTTVVDGQVLDPLAHAGPNAFAWTWRIPYFYCHYSGRLQHSGYVRLMEEVVDRFLASRGIAIDRLLRTRGWIPVVSDARIEIVNDAFMEETITTVYSVEEVFKGLTYDARFECFVRRSGGAVLSARGSITHGYVQIEQRGAGGRLAPFDADVTRALAAEAMLS